MKLFYVALRPSKNYLPWSGALIPQSIIVLKAYENIDNKYNDVSHLQSSAQLYIFYRIVRILEIISFLFLNNSMMFLMCADVVSASCLLSSDRK